MLETLARCFEEAEAAMRSFRADDGQMAKLVETGEAIAACFRQRGRVLICGNGGSMADALHFAEEWTGRFQADRRPYPALALGEATHQSCVANDYGFEQVFSRQVEAFGHEDDVLIILTTTGNSPNLLEAAKTARKHGMKVVGFVGRGGGKLAPLCDIVIDAPGKSSDRIQEIHMAALHSLIEAVERDLGH